MRASLQVTGLSLSPARTHHLAVLGAGHAGVQGRPETLQVPLPGHTWALPSWSLKLLMFFTFVFSVVSVQFSCSVVSDSLRPHESQYARPPCPSPTPRVHSNSCPSSR